MYWNWLFPEKGFFLFWEKKYSKNKPWPTQLSVLISMKCQGFSLGLVLLDVSVGLGTIFHRISVHIVAYTLVFPFESQHWNVLKIFLQIQIFFNENLSQIYKNLDVIQAL